MPDSLAQPRPPPKAYADTSHQARVAGIVIGSEFPGCWTFVDANGDTVGTVIARPGMENFLAD